MIWAGIVIKWHHFQEEWFDPAALILKINSMSELETSRTNLWLLFFFKKNPNQNQALFTYLFSVSLGTGGGI